MPKLSMATANFRQNMGLDPPYPSISKKLFLEAFRIYVTYPHLQDAQWAQVRQQCLRPRKRSVLA